MQYSNYIFNIPTECKYTIKYIYYVFHCISYVHFVSIIKNTINVQKCTEWKGLTLKIIYAVLAGVTKLLVNLGVFNVKQIADALNNVGLYQPCCSAYGM
jgi:hypothetical protein